MTTPLTLAAIRFTDDVPAMRRFLEALGLATTSTRGDGWAVLATGAGQVWLHSAATSDSGAGAGTTELTGEVDDLESSAQHLKDDGLSCSIVDEAYARTLEVTDPRGDTLVLHDHDPEHYGYDQHAGAPDTRLSLSACLFTDPQGAYAGFAQALGLQRQTDPNEWYVPYSAGAGILGLHHDDGTHTPDKPGTGPTVALGFTTAAPLEELQQRLRDAGYDAGQIVTEDFGSRIELTDPDGQHLEIHATPAPVA